MRKRGNESEREQGEVYQRVEGKGRRKCDLKRIFKKLKRKKKDITIQENYLCTRRNKDSENPNECEKQETECWPIP